MSIIFFTGKQIKYIFIDMRFFRNRRASHNHSRASAYFSLPITGGKNADNNAFTSQNTKILNNLIAFYVYWKKCHFEFTSQNNWLKTEVAFPDILFPKRESSNTQNVIPVAPSFSPLIDKERKKPPILLHWFFSFYYLYISPSPPFLYFRQDTRDTNYVRKVFPKPQAILPWIPRKCSI